MDDDENEITSDLPGDDDELDVMVQKLMQLSFTHGVAYKIFAEAQERLSVVSQKAFHGFTEFQRITKPNDKKEVN